MNYPDSACDRPPGPTTLGQRGRTEDLFSKKIKFIAMALVRRRTKTSQQEIEPDIYLFFVDF